MGCHKKAGKRLACRNRVVQRAQVSQPFLQRCSRFSLPEPPDRAVPKANTEIGLLIGTN